MCVVALHITIQITGEKLTDNCFPCVEKSPLFLGTGSDWPIWTWVGDDAEWAGKLLLFSVLNIVSVHWNKLVWRPDWGQEDNSFTSVFNKLDECYHNNLPSAVLPAGDLWLVELLQCGWDLPTVQAFPNCPGNTWLTPPERKRDRERDDDFPQNSVFNPYNAIWHDRHIMSTHFTCHFLTSISIWNWVISMSLSCDTTSSPSLSGKTNSLWLQSCYTLNTVQLDTCQSQSGVKFVMICNSSLIRHQHFFCLSVDWGYIYFFLIN